MKLVNLRVIKCDFRKQKAKFLTIAEFKRINCLFRKFGSANKFVFLEINGSFLVRIRIWKFLSKRSVLCQ